MPRKRASPKTKSPRSKSRTANKSKGRTTQKRTEKSGQSPSRNRADRVTVLRMTAPLSIADVMRMQRVGHELQMNGHPVHRMSSDSGRRAPPLCSSRMKLHTVAPGYDGRMWTIQGGDSGKRWTPFLQGGHGDSVHRGSYGPRRSGGPRKTIVKNGAPKQKKPRKRIVGPNNCCVCDDPLPASGPGSVHHPLIPRACLTTYGRSNAHRMCSDCWFIGKNGRPAFSSETIPHGCPCCAIGKPFPPTLPPTGPPVAAFDLS
jgi:hypothetical protein